MSSRSLSRVASQIFNRPALMTERWACALIASARSQLNVDLIRRVEGPVLDVAGMDALMLEARADADERESRRIYAVHDGVAIIPVEGTLTRSWGLDPYSGFTGYDGIKAKLVAAMDDSSVDAILLDIDSPGGAVAGLFDLVDLIYAFREANVKPIATIANEMACSAAYAIFSAGSPGLRFATRTADVGSIGVLYMHTNVEKALAQDGVEVTIFRAGEKKARVNSVEAIPDWAEKRINDELEKIRTIFVDTVARNLATAVASEDALKKTIRETEGLTYIGTDARGIGLVDAVGSEDQLWSRLLKQLGREI